MKGIVEQNMQSDGSVVYDVHVSAQSTRTDLSRALGALLAKRDRLNKAIAYYEGEHELRYVSEKLREVFGEKVNCFNENWISLVMDILTEKLILNRIVCEDDNVSKLITNLWTNTGLEQDEEDVHLMSVLCNESYVIVWKDPDDEAIVASYQDPRNVHVFYDSENPRKKLFAAKQFVSSEARKLVLVLYYEDRIEVYESNKAADEVYKGLGVSAIKESDFTLNEELGGPNEYGVIPVFHFRRFRREGMGELRRIIPIQDAINKLLNDMILASEFVAIPQRYAVTSANLGNLKSKAGGVWEIPASDVDSESTQVGQFQPANLENHLKALDQLALTISALSGVPKHYFFGTGTPPSGEALISMEARINRKAAVCVKRYASVWVEVAKFLLVLSGVDVKDKEIRAIYRDPETVLPYTRAMIRQTNVAAGMPLSSVLREEGWSEDNITSVLEEMGSQQRITSQQTVVGQPPEVAAAQQAKAADSLATNLAPSLEKVLNGIGAKIVTGFQKSGAFKATTGGQ